MQRILCVLGVASCLWLSTPARTAGQAGAAVSTAVPVDIDALGPQLGDLVPGFTLLDQHGQPRALTSLMGPNGAIIVFFRSAAW